MRGNEGELPAASEATHRRPSRSALRGAVRGALGLLDTLAAAVQRRAVFGQLVVLPDHPHRHLRDLARTEVTGVGEQALLAAFHLQDEAGDRDVREAFDRVSDLAFDGVDPAGELDFDRL